MVSSWLLLWLVPLLGVQGVVVSPSPPAEDLPPAPTPSTTAEPAISKWHDGSEEGIRLQAAGLALSWLQHQRRPDWGWGNDTHRVLIALQLANDSKNEVETSQPSLEMQLSAKQLEIEVLLLKHRETPVSSRQLGEYILALVSLCRDPRRFHGHDLVGSLLHREPAHAQDLALSSLAACSAHARARRRHVRRLLDAASAPADHSIDTMAMVILALRCIVRDHRHRSLQPFLRRPLAGLAKQQQTGGSFGSLRSTARALQALEDIDNESHLQWNRSAAISWVVKQQDSAGSFGDAATTAEVALALSGATPTYSSRRCPHSDHPPLDTHEPAEGIPRAPVGTSHNESDARNVSFTYTLWIGTNVTDNYTLSMIAPRNISFYHVMQMAAEQDPRFEFSASEWPNGHYVHTLAGCREEPMGYHYWLLYHLSEQPDPANPPGNQSVAPVGVDDLLVEEGEHYLFWYKKL